MSKICISLCTGTAVEMAEELKEAEKTGDITELRLDYIKGISKESLEKLLLQKTKPVIVTIRGKNEGGNFEGSKEKRVTLLKKAIELNSDYIDIEISSGKKVISELIKNKKNTKIICSYHNFRKTPSEEELKNTYKQIKSLNPDLIKIATFAESINDNFKIFNLLKNKKDLIALSMGIRGQISRILAPKFGSPITYSCLKENKKTAEGQISAENLINIYNFKSLNKDTEILGVIGKHAENSLSKFIHNANFKRKNQNFVYVPFKTEPEELEEFMKNFRKFNFRGSAVTIPHKVEIMKYMDNIEVITEKIGAVNTVVNSKGRLKGYNTDYSGAIKALEEKISLKEKKAMVLGAGGAAKAICYGLIEKGVEIIIANRTIKKAEELAKELDAKICSLNEIDKEDYDIIINTTSVGMYPDANRSIVDKDALKDKIVFDIVYRPMITEMIKKGKEVNAEIVEGYIMLLYQGFAQYKLWTETEPDENFARKILLKQL